MTRFKMSPTIISTVHDFDCCLVSSQLNQGTPSSIIRWLRDIRWLSYIIIISLKKNADILLRQALLTLSLRIHVLVHELIKCAIPLFSCQLHICIAFGSR